VQTGQEVRVSRHERGEEDERRAEAQAEGPPVSQVFSRSTAAAMAAIQPRLMMPTATRRAISPQQHPTQNAPWCRPTRKSLARPVRLPWWSRKLTGERHWLRQKSLRGVSW